MHQDYKNALERAHSELAELINQRTEIEQRIARLKTTIDGLSALCDERDYSEGLTPITATDATMSETMGLTNAIREIVSVSAVPIKPTEIRDLLVSEGFDEKAYSNMLTVIHNTLTRLERQKEFQQIRMPNGELVGWVKWPEQDRPKQQQGRFQNRFRGRFPVPRGGNVSDYTAAGQALKNLEAEADKKK